MDTWQRFGVGHRKQTVEPDNATTTRVVWIVW